MTEEDILPQFRRISLYRQLSDVLKSKRKSCSHVSPPTTTSGFTFVWNCGLTEMKSSSSKTLVKQKSISYDDLAFLTTNEDEHQKRKQMVSLKNLFFFILNFSKKMFNHSFLFI